MTLAFGRQVCLTISQELRAWGSSFTSAPAVSCHQETSFKNSAKGLLSYMSPAEPDSHTRWQVGLSQLYKKIEVGLSWWSSG